MKNPSIIRLVAGFVLLFSSIAFASENPLTVKQELVSQISDDLRVIQQSRKEPPPEIASPMLQKMTPREWTQLHDEQQKQLTQLLVLINKTSEEELPDVLSSLFFEEQKHINRYPPLDPYLSMMGEQIILPFTKRYDEVAPRTRERMLLILASRHLREALPLVRKALDDPNQRVILTAQTALRLILGLEAKPELEAMLLATKSSWALKHTLREISIIGGKDWYQEFFRLAKSNKISLHDLASLGDPQDCPEEVIAENLDFLMKIISSDNEPEIHPSDIYSLGEFLSYLKGVKGGTSILIHDVVSNIEPQSLESLNKASDATELTGQDEEAVVSAFNKTKDNPWLYPNNASEIELKSPVLKDMLKDLVGRKVFINMTTDNRQVKGSLSVEEQKSIAWFNIYLLNQEFPSVLSKDQYGNSEREVARRMLLRLNQRIYLRELYPLLTGVLRERYGWGGQIESFLSRVTPAPNKILGFRDDQADLFLKNIIFNLQAEDVEGWLRRGSPDFLTGVFLRDLLAKKHGTNINLSEEIFFFKIEAVDRFNHILASSVFQLKHGEEQSIVLQPQVGSFPEHNIKLKVQLDRDKWLFHADLLIDLKPHGAGFDIYIPVAGVNETPLTETLGERKEEVTWRFEHIDKPNHRH